MVLGDAITKLQRFVWIFKHVSRVITWSLFNLRAPTWLNDQSQHDLLYGGVSLSISLNLKLAPVPYATPKWPQMFNGLAKSPRLPRSSWILNECSLYCKIVKYCILSEVCMIKTVPHSTVSPQMWYINGMKGWFTSTQICWQDFVK